MPTNVPVASRPDRDPRKRQLKPSAALAAISRPIKRWVRAGGNATLGDMDYSDSELPVAEVNSLEDERSGQRLTSLVAASGGHTPVDQIRTKIPQEPK